MQSLAFVAPLPAGQIGANRTALASCWSGRRREAHQDSRRRAGVTREAVWIQSRRGEDLAVVYLEADDVGTASAVLGRSIEPFDRWFRDHVRYVHVLALDEGFTVPELVLDFDIDRI
jgi:hypothetical protein